MKMTSKIITILLAMLFIQPAIAVSFTSRDLGANNGTWSVATAINESGTIIGSYYTPRPDGTNEFNPFIWSEDNGMTDIVLPGHDIYYLGDINDQGQITGSSIDCLPGCFIHSFIWSPQDGWNNIDVGPLDIVEAYRLNNNGAVVGRWGSLLGYVWTPTSFVNVGTLGGPYSEAYDINDHGEVVGLSNPTADSSFYQAFIWKDGIMTNLGSLGNNTESGAYAINNRGDIVGVSTNALGQEHVTVWLNDSSPRRMIDLGIPSYLFRGGDIRLGINDYGQVVGTTQQYTNNRGFYWSEEDGLVFLPDEYVSNAYDINNRGQIVGLAAHGNHINATLWTIVGDDTTAPTVTINAPNGTYVLNQIVAADYSCEDPSGVTVCSGTVPNGSNIDTSSVGTKTFSVMANDTLENSKIETITYNVIYSFTGFLPPVDNIPIFNKMKAGGAVPVKFSLNGDQGLDIFAPGYPKSTAIACNDANASEIGANETVTAGQSGLFYDNTLDQYEYIWKTDKSWTGACRQLVLKFNDGITIQRANFQFR